MSNEGLTLIFKVLLALFMIASAAFFRTLLGRGPTATKVLAAGTLAGVASGVVIAEAVSPWFETDVSALTVCGGIVGFWWAGYLIARRAARRAR